MSDTKFALLLNNSEYDYFIPLCREGATREEALQAALEFIDGGEIFHDDGDLDFSIVEIANITKHTTASHQDFFEKKAAEYQARQKAQNDRREREEYERLQNKFGAK